ncbi:MAG: ribbon-helix-helix protein, CopG family [bacterium]|nr:ribbon-helix-helix protein, CopG family [bacterium]
MVRTQIYLPEEQYRELIQIARRQDKPMAEIIRTYIKIGLKKEETVDKSGREIMKALSTLKIKGGPRDLSTNLDHYLYGGPKKKK